MSWPKRIFSALLGLLFVGVAVASEPFNVEHVVQSALQRFVLLDHKNNAVVQQFAVEVIHRHVALERMAQSLCGKQQWAAWTESEQTHVKSALAETLVRYVREAADSYQGQELSLAAITQNGEARRVIRLHIKTVAGVIVPVDLRVQTRDNTLQLDDFSVAGISYVQTKRAQYKALLVIGGLPYLLQNLNEKNAELKTAGL